MLALIAIVTGFLDCQGAEEMDAVGQLVFLSLRRNESEKCPK